MKILIEERKVNGIPILDVYEPNTEQKKPIVIMLHPSNSRKERYIERAFEYAKNGFFVTVFDAYGHGELKDDGDNIEIMSFDKEAINMKLKTSTETSKYINTIVESYEDNIYVDSNRIGLFGVSMGAYTIYYNIIKERNPKIKSAVCFIGSPSWASSVRRSYISYIKNKNIGINEEDIVKAEKYLESIEPLNFSKNLVDFPLLMLNGVEDEIVPIDNVRNAYIKLQENYTDRELIKFIEYEGVGHRHTMKMLDDAFAWLKKYV